MSTQVSTRGQSYMTLNADAVCKILDSCAKLKLTELHFESLHVTFQSETVPASPTIEIPPSPEKTHSGPTEAIQEETVSAEDEFRSKEERIQELILREPALYEEMLMNGELEADAEDRDR